MALWYSATKRRSANDTGKFVSRRLSGSETSTEQRYKGYRYQWVHSRISGTLRRSLYHVTIRDASGRRVDYLPNFASPLQAAQAARDRIDQDLATKAARLGRPQLQT